MNKTIVSAWDYDSSVKRVKPMVVKWGTLTVEMLGELHAAREALSQQASTRERDASGTFVPVEHDWDGYCDDIGLEKRTANRWLARYDAKANALLPEPKDVKRHATEADREAREAEYQRSRPEGDERRRMELLFRNFVESGVFPLRCSEPDQAELLRRRAEHDRDARAADRSGDPRIVSAWTWLVVEATEEAIDRVLSFVAALREVSA